jgi:fermentation-respiration switch protein FrsA (DUF1100 family)
MVDEVFPLFSPFKKLVLNMHWDTAKLILDVKSPILFIVGEKDEIVPKAMMTTLYDLAKTSFLRQKFSVKDGTHNDTWIVGGIEYIEKMNSFFDKCIELRYVFTTYFQNYDKKKKE